MNNQDEKTITKREYDEILREIFGSSCPYTIQSNSFYLMAKNYVLGEVNNICQVTGQKAFYVVWSGTIHEMLSDFRAGKRKFQRSERWVAISRSVAVDQFPFVDSQTSSEAKRTAKLVSPTIEEMFGDSIHKIRD